ncbi:MAG TPA: DMT family transporter, partial [Anaerolineales bacterium]|nr:DMT family transporter [Anaerolineales bacterium]
MRNKTAYGVLCGLGAASIWGGMYVVSKVVLEIIPPFALVALRLILGILALALVVAFRGGLKLKRAQFFQVFGVGFVGYGISLSLQFLGTKLSTAANGSLVTSATPAFVLLFAWLLLSERITARKFFALLLATLGVVAVIDPRSAKLDPNLFIGNIFLLGAAVTWALYSVLVRKVTQSLDVLPFSLIAFIGGLPVAIPAGVWELTKAGVGEISLGVVGGVLFLGIISTALAMILWNTAFAILDAGAASLTFFAQPVVGTLLGWFFLGENITPLFILGGVLIGIGILISAQEDRSENFHS